MGYNSLPEEGIEALTEHALGNYLPFNGGFKQHYQIRNFGRRKKPKGKTRFYAVEYVPFGINLEKSPVYLDKDTFKIFNETEDYTHNPYQKEDDEYYAENPERRQRYEKLRFELNKQRFYKWGKEKGFDFYGYKKELKEMIPEEIQKLRAKPYKEMKKKDWKELKRLEDIHYAKDPLLYNRHTYMYPTQSFFKIGLTNTTAEKRGYFGFDKEDKKKYPNPYKTIFIDKDLTYLYKKVHPADLETFIYFHLFYKYWKDKLFYFSPNKINLTPNPEHQQLKFFGYTESFLFENVEDKLKIINDAFELLESLTKGKINTMIQNMINYERVWNRARLQKLFIMDQFNLDNGNSYQYDPDDPNYKFDNWVFTDRIGYSFFEKIGFWDKYIPRDINNRKHIDDKKIAELFDNKAEEFTLPNVKHYPEISNLETLIDYSTGKYNKTK